MWEEITFENESLLSKLKKKNVTMNEAASNLRRNSHLCLCYFAGKQTHVHINYRLSSLLKWSYLDMSSEIIYEK